MRQNNGFSLTQAQDGMSNSGMGAFSSSSSSSYGASAARRSVRSNDQTIRSLTIHQILSATANENIITVDEAVVAMVTLVGYVASSKATETFLSMRLTDRTGDVECRMFISKSDEGVQHHHMMEDACRAGSYVRIFGTVNMYGNNRYVRVLSAFPVTDYNEVVMHQTEVVANHLLRMKECKGATPNMFNKQGASGSYNQEGDNSAYGNANIRSPQNSGLGNRQGGYGAQQQSGQGQQNPRNQQNQQYPPSSNFQNYYQSSAQSVGNKISDMFLQIMMQSNCRNGSIMNRHALYQQIRNKLGGSVLDHELAHAVDLLINQNHIYQTGTDDEFSLV